MSRLTQILRGKKIKPLTEMESAVKYAIEHSGGMLVCEGTIDSTGETPTLTLDKTAKEVYDAVSSGLGLMFTASFGVDVTTTLCPYVAVNKNVGEAATSYDIRFTLADGTLLAAEKMSGTDAAVLSMVTD